ncbi:MAG: helix-turn-helix domain-containing protein [Pirellulaceae bacterium]
MEDRGFDAEIFTKAKSGDEDSIEKITRMMHDGITRPAVGGWIAKHPSHAHDRDELESLANATIGLEIKGALSICPTFTRLAAYLFHAIQNDLSDHAKATDAYRRHDTQYVTGKPTANRNDPWERFLAKRPAFYRRSKDSNQEELRRPTAKAAKNRQQQFLEDAFLQCESRREREVIRLRWIGWKDEDIAHRLGITERTVRNIRQRVEERFYKLHPQCRSREDRKVTLPPTRTDKRKSGTLATIALGIMWWVAGWFIRT